MKHPSPYNTLQSYLENSNFRKVMVVCDERILQLHEEFVRIHLLIINILSFSFSDSGYRISQRDEHGDAIVGSVVDSSF